MSELDYTRPVTGIEGTPVDPVSPGGINIDPSELADPSPATPLPQHLLFDNHGGGSPEWKSVPFTGGGGGSFKGDLPDSSGTSAPPTTAQVPTGCFAFWLDTDDGRYYMVKNRAGVLYFNEFGLGL